MLDELTICFPVARGPQSFCARILAMSIRKSFPSHVNVIAFQTPNEAPLSLETLDIFDWLNVSVANIFPIFYYRHPEYIFKHLDITKFEFSTRFVMILNPNCIFLKDVKNVNLPNLFNGFMSVSSRKKDTIEEGILKLCSNYTGLNKIIDSKNIDFSGDQFDPSVIFYDHKGNFSTLWRRVTGALYNSELGQKIKESAPIIALQLLSRSLNINACKLPSEWGKFPHMSQNATLLRYDRLNAIFSKPQIGNDIIRFERLANEVGYTILGELTSADIRFLIS